MINKSLVYASLLSFGVNAAIANDSDLKTTEYECYPNAKDGHQLLRLSDGQKITSPDISANYELAQCYYKGQIFSFASH